MEIGYGLRKGFCGKGYMTEAVRAICRWALAQPGVSRVEAETAPDNIPSRRVLEACGFVPAGVWGEEGPRFVLPRGKDPDLTPDETGRTGKTAEASSSGRIICDTEEKPVENKQPSFLELLLEAHIGLERQGPGSPEVLEKALSFLGAPEQFQSIADLGCGTGGQTLLLAERLPGNITGLDMFPAFAEELNRKANSRGLDRRVRGVVGQMEALPFPRESLDLIWSEGAIDNIGFRTGLEHWRSFLKTGGYLAVTCPSWLTRERPAEAEQFWADAGSRLDPVEENIWILQESGYAFVSAFALPTECWTENYYAPREKAIQKLLEKYDRCESVCQYAALNRREVELYSRYHDCYGYVFYIGRAV